MTCSEVGVAGQFVAPSSTKLMVPVVAPKLLLALNICTV